MSAAEPCPNGARRVLEYAASPDVLTYDLLTLHKFLGCHGSSLAIVGLPLLHLTVGDKEPKPTWRGPYKIGAGHQGLDAAG